MEPLPGPLKLIDFTLTERSGHAITRMDLTNQFLVVNLVFTSCNLICRSVNDRMEEIQRLMISIPGPAWLPPRLIQRPEDDNAPAGSGNHRPTAN